MSERKALIVWGGWEGHEPKQVGEHFANILKQEGFSVEISDTLERFEDGSLKDLSLIVPIWTMGQIKAEQANPVIEAVKSGVGLAGCHGGMCDAFRESVDWQFMTGGNWVAHPGNDGVRYRINICRDNPHEITKDLPDFNVESEQYYLHVDPAVNVLATTDFPNHNVPGPHDQNRCQMPQVWTKYWGEGRVFYNALGHVRAVFDIPEATELMRRGFLWAAR
jgi:hypothetical protein